MAVESRFSSLEIAARNGRDEFRTSSLRLSGAGGANGIRGGVGETKKKHWLSLWILMSLLGGDGNLEWTLLLQSSEPKCRLSPGRTGELVCRV